MLTKEQCERYKKLGMELPYIVREFYWKHQTSNTWLRGYETPDRHDKKEYIPIPSLEEQMAFVADMEVGFALQYIPERGGYLSYPVPIEDDYQEWFDLDPQQALDKLINYICKEE